MSDFVKYHFTKKGYFCKIFVCLPGIVKYLYDAYAIKFLLTGSSSFYLKNYFTESLAGRKVIFDLFPLTFGEFLDFHGVPYRRRSSFSEMRFDPYEYGRLKGLYDVFLQYGGLPDIVLETRPTVIQYLEFLEMTYVIHRLPAFAGGDKPSADLIPIPKWRLV